MKIEGSCIKCGECCKFSYYVRAYTDKELKEQFDYAKRFFPEAGIKIIGTYDGILIGMIDTDLHCSHYHADSGCSLHGTKNKPRTCVAFPLNFDSETFKKVRAESCGFSVVAD